MTLTDLETALRGKVKLIEDRAGAGMASKANELLQWLEGEKIAIDQAVGLLQGHGWTCTPPSA